MMHLPVDAYFIQCYISIYLYIIHLYYSVLYYSYFTSFPQTFTEDPDWMGLIFQLIIAGQVAAPLQFGFTTVYIGKTMKYYTSSVDAQFVLFLTKPQHRTLVGL